MDKKSFDDDLNEIQVSIARTILTQVEKKTISFETGQEIAKYVLAEIDQARNISQLSGFLKKLSQKWPIFETMHGLYQIREKEANNNLQKGSVI